VPADAVIQVEQVLFILFGVKSTPVVFSCSIIQTRAWLSWV